MSNEANFSDTRKEAIVHLCHELVSTSKWTEVPNKPGIPEELVTVFDCSDVLYLLKTVFPSCDILTPAQWRAVQAGVKKIEQLHGRRFTDRSDLLAEFLPPDPFVSDNTAEINAIEDEFPVSMRATAGPLLRVSRGNAP